MDRLEEYEPLATSSEYSEEKPLSQDNIQVSPRKDQSSGSRLLLWACVGAICSSIISVTLFATATVFRQGTEAVVPTPLRRPNTYVHLYHDLDTTVSTFHPITNIPKITMQMGTRDPQRKMTEDGRYERLGGIQSYYPDDRHVVISPEISTIVQFRHLDYGMERCILNASLPGSTARFNPAIALGDSATVQVWRLDGEAEISPYDTAAWTKAQKRVALLTTLSFSPSAESSSEEFHCKSGGYTTVELACPSSSTSSCLVDFWQDPERAPGGLVITQMQSMG